MGDSDAVLTRGGLRTGMLRFGAPLALGMAFQGLFNCVDLVIVGRLGAGAIAAVTAAGIVNMAAMLLFNGIANMMAAFAARLAGEGRSDAVRRLSGESLGVTAIASLILGGGFYLLATPLIRRLGVDPTTEADAVLYLEIMSAGSGTMFFILYGTAILRGFGDGVRPMIVLIVSNVLNVALDFLLVFGLLGCPRLEVAGAAWATVIARAVGCLMLLGPMARRGVLGRIPSPRSGWRYAGSMLRRGVGSSLQLVVRVVGLYVLLASASAVVARSDGAAAARDLLDGVGMCIRLEMIVVFVALGWGTAAGAVVGQNLGASSPDRAVRGTWWAGGFAAASALLFGAVFLGGHAVLFRAVGPDLSEATRAEAARYLMITAPAYVLLVTGVVLSQALAGAGSTGLSLLLDSVVYLGLLNGLAVPLMRARGGPEGAWIALVIAHAAAATLYIATFHAGVWKKKVWVDPGVS